MTDSNNPRSWLEKLFLIILFLISYGIIWFISTFFFSPNGFFSFSPMHWLIPIPAFFFAFWAYDWIEEYFRVKLSSWWFPILLVVLGFLAFVINAWFYYCNGFSGLQSQGALSLGCDEAGSKRAIEFVSANWWNVLKQDAFFYFWLALFFGWLARIVWRHAVHPVSKSHLDKRKKKK